MKMTLKVLIIVFFLLGVSLVVYAANPIRTPRPSGEVAPTAGPVLIDITADPYEVAPNGTITISALLDDPSGIDAVSVFVKRGSQTVATVPLYDDGQHGDDAEFDGLFASQWNVGNRAGGEYTFVVQSRDRLGNQSVSPEQAGFNIVTAGCSSDADCQANQVCCSSVCYTPECSVSNDCPDRACQVKSCDTSTCPAQCGYTDITACVNSDGCCPVGCTIGNDDDCADTTPPLVSFVAPPSNPYTVTTMTYTVTVTATDPETLIDHVEFFLDSSYLGQQTPPASGNDYNWIYDFSGYIPGSTHTVQVIAYNRESPPLATTASTSVILNIPGGNPTATITSPTNLSVVSGTVTVRITAADTDGGTVNKVSLFHEVTGWLADASFTPGSPVNVTIPWNTTLYPSDGTAQCIYAGAYDNNNQYGQSPTICVYPDNEGPTVTFTKPFLDGLNKVGNVVGGGSLATFPSHPDGTVTVAVDAKDPASGVKYVEFYKNSVLQTTVGVPPYEWLWDADKESEGSKIDLSAVALDQAGNGTKLAPVTVIVEHCAFVFGGCDYKAGYQCCLSGDNTCSLICGGASL